MHKFGYLRVAAVVPELQIGNVEFNTEEIRKQIEIASRENADIIVFPELSITGYSCADLFFQESLINKAANALGVIAKYVSHFTVVVGLPILLNGRLYNCAAVINQGRVVGLVPKTYLPSRNEFYESRWFTPATHLIDHDILRTDFIFQYDLAKISIEICEDVWAPIPPSSFLAVSGANVILNLSASTEVLGKYDYRKELVKQQSARCNSAYVYVSAGPNESTTDVVYSGHSIIAENGTILNESSRFTFESHITYADIDVQKLEFERLRNSSFSMSKPEFTPTIVDLVLRESSNTKFLKVNNMPFIPSNTSKRDIVCDEIFNIQTAALTKRIKHTGITKTTLGLSGGLDSTLAILVLLKTYKNLKLPLTDIYAIGMPGPASTDRTQSNAKKLAELLGVTFKCVDICDAVDLHLKNIGYDFENPTIAFENAQARERTQIIFDIANDIGALAIGTGDLSESALGWCTYGGDHLSMYNVNCSIPKTLVRYIVDYVARHEYDNEIQKVLLDICDTPISPELLLPNKDGTISQHTEDKVGPYLLNDFFLFNVVRYHFSPEKIFFLAQIAFKDNYSKEEIHSWLVKFYKRFFNTQFKRSAVPDGPKVGSVSLSPRGDWRMPSDAEVSSWLKCLDKLGE